MSGRDDITDQQERAVAELIEMGLDFARSLKAKVEDLTSVDEAERLALAFHRVTRTVRLALALQSKLARERLEIANGERDRFRVEASERLRQVRAVVTRQIWRETEGDGAERLVSALHERLEEDALFAAFLDGPVEAAIARIRADLGLPANDGAPADPRAAPLTARRRSG